MTTQVQKIKEQLGSNWIMIVLSFIAVVLIVATLTAQKVQSSDQCTDVTVCEYEKLLILQKQQASDVLVFGREADEAKKQYQYKLKAYYTAQSNYKNTTKKIDAIVLWSWQVETWLNKIEYDAGFLRHLDYDVPHYDPNLRLVQFASNTSDTKLKYMSIAYQLWWADFVYTIHGENNTRDPQRQSDCYGKECKGPESWLKREESYGFCQLNKKSYWEFLDSAYFDNHETQLIKCWNEYKKAMDNGSIKTKFYAYNNRSLYIDLFIFTK